MPLADWNPPTMEEAVVLPGLNSGGLLIRPYHRDDADAHFAAASGSRERLGPWMPWCHSGYARSDSEAWIASRAGAWDRGEAFDFVIIDETKGDLVGACALNEINRDRRCANLGYWVRSDVTGRGIASKAARMLARFGFLHLGLRRIEIVAAVDNISSQRAAIKAGATREGLLRNRLLLRGVFHDAVLFSLLPQDLD